MSYRRPCFTSERGVDWLILAHLDLFAEELPHLNAKRKSDGY